MAKSEIFAIRDSGLHAFLLADVGIEANGSSLTVLSMLARLGGEDPWERAARWAAEPRDRATEALAASLTAPSGINLPLDHARAMASRLLLLLPGTATAAAAGGRPPIPPAVIQHWAWLILAFFWLYLILATLLSAGPKPPAAVAQPHTSTTRLR